MQRILSLATLGVLGGLVWMFLSGGGLNQLAATDGAGADSSAAAGTAARRLARDDAGAVAIADVQPAAPASAAPPAGVGPTITHRVVQHQSLRQEKADKPYVMHTLAEIVRQFHVVAIQEIRTQDDYFIPKFVELINQPRPAAAQLRLRRRPAAGQHARRPSSTRSSSTRSASTAAARACTRWAIPTTCCTASRWWRRFARAA